MCFNDDFDFDFDDYDGMDDDFSEDMFEEEFEPEQDEFEMEAENHDPIDFGPETSESTFDFREAFILGGMIIGQAYENGLDEKEQRNKKGNDDGDDSV